MQMIKRWQTLIPLFLLTLIGACYIHMESYSAYAKPSAYAYLVRVADQFLTDSNSQTTSNSKLGFLVSFQTQSSSQQEFDRVMQNVAFTYDNAVAALAFIAFGDRERAQQIVDTLITAQNHDRFYTDGRIRNAYRGGKRVVPQRAIDLPGWYDIAVNRWQENEFQISTHTGNVAWAMLALLGYYQAFGGNSYLAAAEKMGEWIEANCRSDREPAGYTGGYAGWENRLNRLIYKSTEHNLDLYPAFERLYQITGNPAWRERATRSRNFVLAMWDETEGKFWTGTQADGVTINRDFIPLDAQAWAILALRDTFKAGKRPLEYAERHLKVAQGFDFNQDRDGIWYEGTAHMAVAYQFTGQFNQANVLISSLVAAQDKSGGLPAADRDGLTTGIWSTDGTPWLYFKRPHVGATAWLVLAQKQVNPFWPKMR